MGSSSAAVADDDMLSVFSKPKPEDNSTSSASPDDQVLQAFSKPAPAAAATPIVAPAAAISDAPRWDLGGDISRAASSAYGALKEDVANAFSIDRDKAAAKKGVGASLMHEAGKFGSAVKIPFDALGVVTSPITGALHTVGGSALSYLPGVNKQQGDEGIDTALMGLGPGKGAPRLVVSNRLVGTPSVIEDAAAANNLVSPQVAASPAAMPEAAPSAPVAPGAPVAPQNALVAPPAAAPVAETGGNKLIPPAPAEAPPGGPVPQSVGAAASGPGTATSLTPSQVARYQSSADGRKLLETQMPGIADATAYVPGVSASTAEVEQTVNASREAKIANIQHPEASQTAKEIAEANSEHRKNFFENMSGDAVTTGLLKDERSAQATTDLAAAFKNPAQADTTPIAASIRDTLDIARNRQNDEMQGYLKPLLSRLQNADGTPKITDAEELYGFREQVNKMLSKASQRKDPGLEHVSGEIRNLLPVIDGQIEAAAPGYRQYMDNYAQASRGIDEEQVLQDHKNGLFNSQNQMTYNGVQRMMKNIVDARGATGLNPYKSISDDTMAKLWNLRDDLRRSASAQELARTPGSDTAQNTYDMLKRGALGAVRLGAHGVANYVAPVLGSMAVNTGEAMLGASRAAKAQRMGLSRALQNLNPNRLIPPED